MGVSRARGTHHGNNGSYFTNFKTLVVFDNLLRCDVRPVILLIIFSLCLLCIHDFFIILKSFLYSLYSLISLSSGYAPVLNYKHHASSLFLLTAK